MSDPELTSDAGNRLEDLLAAEPAILYAFAATSDGRILAERGDTRLLPEVGIVDVLKRPESVEAFYVQCLEYLKEGPDFVPRLYGQGSVHAIIGPPAASVLVALFVVSPQPVAGASREVRAEWVWSTRGRVWTATKRAFEHQQSDRT